MTYEELITTHKEQFLKDLKSLRSQAINYKVKKPFGICNSIKNAYYYRLCTPIGNSTLIFKLLEGWDKRIDNIYTPITMSYSHQNNWKGENRILRIEAMDFIINKLENM